MLVNGLRFQTETLPNAANQASNNLAVYGHSPASTQENTITRAMAQPLTSANGQRTHFSNSRVRRR